MSSINRLSMSFVSKVAKAGIYPDGGGLCLQVASGRRGIGKSWIFRYSVGGKARAMGFGGYPAVSLAEARARRDAALVLVKAGCDPIVERDRPRAEARRLTFGDCAAAYISAHEGSWRNEKHRAQWRMTLETYAAQLWSVPVDEVATAAVLEALQPLWQAKPETASRLRGRIEAVLDAARVAGHIGRNEANPARWKGHLEKLLPAAKTLSRGHHAALDYREIAAFIVDLRQREGIAARALEFLILTAARTGEITEASWGEFDLEAGVWTVPGSRMKSGREHRVALSDAAIGVLEAMPRVASRVLPVSNMAMPMLLRRMGRGDLTVHGFRSTFRDWAGDVTQFQREVVEAALAHTIGDKAEQAYRRSDALEKRRALMAAWASYCFRRRRADVVPIRA